MIYKLRILNRLYRLIFIATLLLILGFIALTESMCGRLGLTINCSYNNDILKRDYKVGDVVSYSCVSWPCYSPNLMPRRCQENGSWSGTIPFCYKSSGLETIDQVSIVKDQKRYDAGFTMDGKNDTCFKILLGPDTFWIAVLTKPYRIVAVRVTFPDRIKEISLLVDIMEGNSSRSTCESYQRKSDSDKNSQLFVCKKGVMGDRVIITQQITEPYNENEHFELCEVNIFLQPNYGNFFVKFWLRAVRSWPENVTKMGLGIPRICTQITCDPTKLEVSNEGQWVPLNETISIRVLICQTGYHIEGSPAVTRCLPNGSWSYTMAVCRKTPLFDTWNSEWTPSTILLSAVAVGAGTAICILCLAMCFLVLKKRRQSKINSTVFHVGVSDSILYHEGSKDQQYKANTYEDLIELRQNPTNTKPRKPCSALPHLPILPMDTDPVYAQPFETVAFPKLTSTSTGGDIYTAHIYAEPIDSHIPLSGPSAFNSASETWLRSGAKKFGRKMSLPGRASLPEDSKLQTNQINSTTLRFTDNSLNTSSTDKMLDEKDITTQYEPKMPDTTELINNSVYLDTTDTSFKPKKDLDQFQMIDNDIYQDDYFSNV
ncbi:uncharacterized protein NPIL_295441 [Nephila pilipes]|uniref:Sushi domain-containing protein n=1 Tax=Nephila pilipes TaxID=299642 RepID=A0A8X6QZA8_NEPPI|nr:uncharacterized protein NPIL_295441 [Nephila pilipes]